MPLNRVAAAGAVFFSYILPIMHTFLERISAAAAGFLFLAAASLSAAEPLSRSEYVLWTQCTVTLYDHPDPSTLDEAFTRLGELHARLSVNVPGSELDAVSDAAGRAPVRVGKEVFLVIGKGLHLAEISGGLFDPTVGPLMKAWKMNSEDGQVPAPADLARARALVNWRDVVMDEKAQTIFLRRPGMRLDAGGLLKGYAADEVVRILSARGVRSAIVDLGGDIYALGGRPDGEPWRIGVQNPDATRGETLGVVRVTGKSVVSSGSYEHFFIQDGKRYHHIMDTRTGFPVDSGLDQVTVISDSSVDADGLGLTLFALGAARGRALADSLGIDAIMVGTNRVITMTDGARKLFTLGDTTFTVAPR
jgi:thiamine biosynthesis lipoprotein